MVTSKALINPTIEELQAFHAFTAEGLLYEKASDEDRNEMQNKFFEWLTDGKQGGALGLLAKYESVTP